MKAEEIRRYAAEVPNIDPSPRPLIVILGELAAQLAELNERLSTWSWPDGSQGIITK